MVVDHLHKLIDDYGLVLEDNRGKDLLSDYGLEVADCVLFVELAHISIISVPSSRYWLPLLRIHHLPGFLFNKIGSRKLP